MRGIDPKLEANCLAVFLSMESTSEFGHALANFIRQRNEASEVIDASGEMVALAGILVGALARPDHPQFQEGLAELKKGFDFCFQMGRDIAERKIQ